MKNGEKGKKTFSVPDEYKNPRIDYYTIIISKVSHILLDNLSASEVGAVAAAVTPKIQHVLAVLATLMGLAVLIILVVRVLAAFVATPVVLMALRVASLRSLATPENH